MTIAAIANRAPVIPVLVIDNIDSAVPLANALVRGGLPVLEVTLRTPAALAAIKRMADSCPDAIIGAGTIRNGEDIMACRKAGAAFGVSPGAPASLLAALAGDVAENGDWPFLPGCATASEAMLLSDFGYEMLKFFPAEQSGGAAMLKSLAGPLPDIHFCPTGGIGAHNAADYLTLPNVRCVGGSWVVPAKMVAAKDWDGITKLAAEASKLNAR